MNIISKQYYKFLSTLQKIFRITNSKEVKITKVDKGIICFQNEKGNNVEISTAHDVVQYCSNDYKNRKLFTYDGVKIQPIGKGNDESVSKISLVYNQEEINFFSFTINCLAKDYENPKKSKELKKTLSITQIISYLTKFTIDPIYTRLLYDYINPEDLVQPFIDTIGEIKNFFKREKIDHISYLNIDKENKTISFRIVTVKNINGKIVKNIVKAAKISKSDIPTENNNRYNIDYYDSILECLHKDIKFLETSATQSFTIDEFYAKLFLYSKRFDCLVPLKLVASTTEGQKTDKFTNVQETNTEHSVSPRYTQILTNSSTKYKSVVANITKNQGISKTTIMRSDNAEYYTPLSHTQNDYPLVNSSTEHNGLILCKPCSNEQQFSASSLVLAAVIPGLIILLAFILAYCYYKKRNSDKVRTSVGAVELAPLNNERHCN
ncbi:MAG: hypothetical protein U0X86_000807 [Wolbachia endosymbiont of Xenopsylla cheopis]